MSNYPDNINMAALQERFRDPTPAEAEAIEMVKLLRDVIACLRMEVGVQAATLQSAGLCTHAWTPEQWGEVAQEWVETNLTAQALDALETARTWGVEL